MSGHLRKEVDVRPARGDDNRHAKFLPQTHCGESIGIDVMRVNQIKRLFRMQLPHNFSRAACHPLPITTHAYFRRDEG